MRVAAAVAVRSGEPFSNETLEVDEPRDDEVLVRVMAAGLSRIDLLARDQDIPVPLPAVFGREGAGQVEQVGARVSGLDRGDRVVFVNAEGGPHLFGPRMSRFRPEGSAPLHRRGKPVGGNSVGHSCFASHVLASERNLVKMPGDDTPFSILAALAGDVQTGASAIIETLRPRPGNSVGIFGVGAAGLGAVIAARLAGCHPIIAASRLDLAEELGAAQTIDPDGLDPVEAIRSLTGGVEFAVETTGDPGLVGQAIESLAPGGTCSLAGMGALDAEVSLKLRLLLQRRILIGNPFGAIDPASFVHRLVALYRRGHFPVDRLIAEFRLDEINKAADALLSGAAVKPVLVMD
jgi:aryl-alcohol dehydrogenase